MIIHVDIIKDIYQSTYVIEAFERLFVVSMLVHGVRYLAIFAEKLKMYKA